MGILREVASMVTALRLPGGFSVCELGDQGMSGLKEPQLAKAWYQSLGCTRYVAIDANGRGTVTLDLNLPIPDRLRSLEGSFELVTDFGTGEHVFDQAQVWRTLHALAMPGGFIAFDRPAQGYPWHCFYRIDRCLLDDIAEANAYAIVRIESALTPRGELVRGIFRKMTARPFVVPQQGRYRSTLQLERS